MGSGRIPALIAAVMLATAGGCGTGVNPLECGDSLWVFGGVTPSHDDAEAHHLLRSFDGTHWTVVTTMPAVGFPLILPSGIWFVGTLASDYSFTDQIWHSVDGKKWTEESTGYSRKILGYGVVFGGSFFLMGGTPAIFGYASGVSEIFSGTDPLHGSVSGPLPGASISPNPIVFKDQIWIVGGEDTTGTPSSEVFASSDATSWNAKANIPAPRETMALFNFNDKLWAVGGDSNTTGVDTIYSTTDGSSWTTESPLPGGPLNSVGVTYQGKMWLLGGDYDPDGLLGGQPDVSYSTVWSSSDGVNWTEAGNLPEARQPFAAAHFDPCSFTR